MIKILLIAEKTKTTKISFTYYGISLSHLREILHKDGIEGITDEEISRQNPVLRVAKFISRAPRFSLACAIARTRSLHLVTSATNLEKSPFGRRQRRASKR